MSRRERNPQSELESLIETYGDRILRFWYLDLMSSDVAQSTVQDIFVKIYSGRKISSKRLSENQIFRIMIRQCRKDSTLKKIGRTDIGDFSLLWLEKMPAMDQEIFLLRYYMDVQPNEIARICGILPFVVRHSLLHQCSKLNMIGRKISRSRTQRADI